MNTLKIQIKPYYQNNPFNLKDDQIHCLSTNKDEEEIQLLLKQMNLSNYTVFLQLDMENYTYGYLHTSSNKEYDLFLSSRLSNKYRSPIYIKVKNTIMAPI